MLTAEVCCTLSFPKTGTPSGNSQQIISAGRRHLKERMKCIPIVLMISYTAEVCNDIIVIKSDSDSPDVEHYDNIKTLSILGCSYNGLRTISITKIMLESGPEYTFTSVPSCTCISKNVFFTGKCTAALCRN